MNKKLIVISAPSGGGKSVVTRHIMKLYPNVMFSISATTRERRPLEKDGKDYYFLQRQDFISKIENGDMAEYEEIFGNFYGTLKSEIEKVFSSDTFMLFDIDVKGALSLRKAYPNDTVLIFLKPPSLQVLEDRLRKRNTETDEQISRRLSRSKMEIDQAELFDFIIVNEVLEETFKSIEQILISS